jgi:uncharacterized membrane protein YfcA
MELIYFATIITLACFVQAVAGFGLPMIATPVLVALFGIRATVPLMAIIILELQLFMILRYRMALNIQTVWRISAAAILGIPIGVLFLSRIPETITITLLGLILIFYVLYSLSSLPVPALKNPNWTYFFGFLSGVGGGAYNIAAPPMIIYADTQRWEPKLFKGNLQGCFLIITVVAILTHSLSGNVTGDVLQKSLIAIPFVLAGALAGFYLDRFINPAVFRKIVLGLLLILGINLALTGRSLQQSRRTPGDGLTGHGPVIGYNGSSHRDSTPSQPPPARGGGNIPRQGEA